MRQGTFLDFVKEISDTENEALEVTDVLGRSDGDFRSMLFDLRKIRFP